jgi:hypothetical protein
MAPHLIDLQTEVSALLDAIETRAARARQLVDDPERMLHHLAVMDELWAQLDAWVPALYEASSIQQARRLRSANVVRLHRPA